jgi:hypothetical protein
MRWVPLILIGSALGCATATVGGQGAAQDPSTLNPSQPHPPGEANPVNAGSSAADAALMTGIAVGSSAVQRHSGGCYANCPPGTTCNPATGLCDDQPCHGRCSSEQICDTTSGPFPQCVARNPEDLKIHRDSPP